MTAPSDWESLARAAASPTVAPEDRTLRRELVGFRLAGDPYALSVERIREIARVSAITPIPHVPDVVLGVISLRGEMLQVIDLRRRLGKPVPPPSRGDRILVTQTDEGRLCGLLVDRVTGVLRISESLLKAPPDGAADHVWALYGQNDQFVTLLDPDRVVAFDVDA